MVVIALCRYHKRYSIDRSCAPDEGEFSVPYEDDDEEKVAETTKKNVPTVRKTTTDEKFPKYEDDDEGKLSDSDEVKARGIVSEIKRRRRRKFFDCDKDEEGNF